MWWLRCYPHEWRQRYGDELQALLDDTYDGRPPWSARVGMARAGLAERARAAGLRRQLDPVVRTRDGALLVLWGWAAFVVAGCAYAKFAEHWDAFTPGTRHAVPAAAYAVVEIASGVGAVIVAVAAIVALPSFLRLLRAGGWARVARPIVRAAAVFAATAALAVPLAVWAHHLGPAQRDGGSSGFAALAIVWVGLVIGSIVFGAAAAVACARAVVLTPRQLRVLGPLAEAAVVCMVVIAAGVVVWWQSLASSAPGFLSQGLLAGAGSPLPPTLVGAAVLMAGGLALAAVGTVKVASARPQLAGSTS
jgi:hypothetical protein